MELRVSHATRVGIRKRQITQIRFIFFRQLDAVRIDKLWIQKKKKRKFTSGHQKWNRTHSPPSPVRTLSQKWRRKYSTPNRTAFRFFHLPHFHRWRNSPCRRRAARTYFRRKFDEYAGAVLWTRSHLLRTARATVVWFVRGITATKIVELELSSNAVGANDGRRARPPSVRNAVGIRRVRAFDRNRSVGTRDATCWRARTYHTNNHNNNKKNLLNFSMDFFFTPPGIWKTVFHWNDRDYNNNNNNTQRVR